MKLRGGFKRLLTVAWTTAVGLLCAADSSLTKEKDALTPSPNVDDVKGFYYRGSGLAYNIDLILKAGGTYSARWHSCLYKAGEATGKWVLSSNRISFIPPIEGEMLKRPLSSVNAIKSDNEWVLVSSDAEGPKTFEREGITPYSCFQRIDVRTRWAGTWHLAFGAMGEFHTLTLQPSGEFVWLMRDEPLRAQDTYRGQWEVRNDRLLLSFISGRTNLGEALVPKKSKAVLLMSSDRQSLSMEGNSEARFEKSKQK
jgi:hypothetical protein